MLLPHTPHPGIPSRPEPSLIPSQHHPGATHNLYVLCSVAVGRTFVIDKRDPASPLIIPPGFDSLYVAKDVLDPMEGEKALSASEAEAAASHDLDQTREYSYEFMIQVRTVEGSGVWSHLALHERRRTSGMWRS